MSKFEKLTSRMIPLIADDVDTDQIIPARFLKVTSRAGLGEHLFEDRKDFAIAPKDAAGAQILLSGANFGCGSSREHAPWALQEFGFRAVIARSFADIFRQNALKNGLLPVEVDVPLHRWLIEARTIDPALTLTVDLEATALILPDGESVPFPIDPFARHCLLNGLDELTYLQSHASKIAAFEARNG
jgi:3-isopropylmalate/(R)-2-methylmalate dehydratase small subunit